ncbi:glycosyltransferase family 4 protein [Subtercola boreus]|uniref:Mannosyltransferase n=1 Tax=Subtercola boreus TaxID=120213 RepID=A0A3E0WB37_9MICO|nr:glycosyltransferase family 1 protein [Subtercola boreus]RFA21229.1 mannosyltransferase [Subtercola boreus]RFA21612.1 mannosyltransferase [Subtercola boreus]RFA27581.1 mannosyltransferase [Subtercola boreus]
MKIVFDCRYTRIGRHDGISRYTAGLVTALAHLHPVTMLISDKRQLELLPDLPYAMASSPTSPLELFVARQVNKLEPDVVFTPMQTMGTMGRRYPLALTVHDLIYYSNPTPPREFAPPLRLLWRLYHLSWWPQRLLLNRADAVVTVSHTTRALVEQHHLTSKPIVVVSNAADTLDTDSAVRASVPTGETNGPVARAAARSLVYMGSFMPYKNVETLVRAMALLPGYTLHLMSGVRPADRERLQALAPDARLTFHDGASDAEYLAAIDGATALVSASLEEGFGIPLVESMGRSTPVVVSDIPVFREIGGDAALYFEAQSPAAFAGAVRKLEDPKEWFRRSLASKERAETFSWESSATALLALLEELAASPARR